MPRKRPPSRTARWYAAAGAARLALDEVLAAKDNLTVALQDLAEVQSEYVDWRDNLPENLADSALGEKLNTVADLDLEWDENDLDAAASMVDEAEGADLPLGFGRD